MIGRGSAGAAVSVVNALFDGTGASLGIDLTLQVTVEAGPTTPAAPPRSMAGARAASPLIVRTLEAAAEALGGRREEIAVVSITSEIPPAVGLKSSSALGVALVRAVARAYARPLPDEAAARLAAEAARRAGQSATGAFDDAMAAAAPGLWATDNRTDRVLFHQPPPDAELLLWLPPGRHPPSPALADRFDRAAPSGALEALRSGRLWEAMERNSAAVERCLGTTLPVRELLRAEGAYAVAVSGLGPAVAIPGPADRLAAMERIVRDLPGAVRRVGFRRGPTAPEER